MFARDFRPLIGVLSDSDPNFRRLLRFYGSSEGRAVSSVEVYSSRHYVASFCLGCRCSRSKLGVRAVSREAEVSHAARASRPFACGSGVLREALVSVEVRRHGAFRAQPCMLPGLRFPGRALCSFPRPQRLREPSASPRTPTKNPFGLWGVGGGVLRSTHWDAWLAVVLGCPCLAVL